MTKKSASRRQRDAQAFQAAGGKAPSPRVVRETSARVWFELKNVHKRSAAYITKTAQQIAKYGHPVVLAKIAKNGKAARFNELNAEIVKKVAGTMADFAALWDSHKDKRELCRTSIELEIAYKIFEAYQVFDMSFYEDYSGIISEMNEIYNEALAQLLGQATDAQDPTVITDVEAKSLPTAAENVAKPAGQYPEAKVAAGSLEETAVAAEILTESISTDQVDPKLLSEGSFVDIPPVWEGRGLTSCVVHLDDAGTATDSQGYPEGENPRTASEFGLVNGTNGISAELIGAHDAHPADSTVPAGKIDPDAPFELDPAVGGLIRIKD